MRKLWDEIPLKYKKVYELNDINEDGISLRYLTNTSNTNVATSAAQTKSANKNDCFACDYFPMCKFDEKLSFGGKMYRGWRGEDGSIIYYYCENGDVTMKWITSYNPDEIYRDYDPFTNIETIVYTQGATKYTLHSTVILKSNTPVGKDWGSGSREHRFFMIAKDTSVIVEGVKYNNVIIVKEHDTYYKFYAKGLGFIKKYNWQDYDVITGAAALSKGTVDPDIVGTWALDVISADAIAPYWRFNADGTGEFSYLATFKYDGINRKFRWRIAENAVLLQEMETAVGRISKKRITKSLPAITIEGFKLHRQ